MVQCCLSRRSCCPSVTFCRYKGEVSSGRKMTQGPLSIQGRHEQSKEGVSPQDPPHRCTWASLTSTRPRLLSSFMICRMAILTSTCTRFCTSDTWRILGEGRARSGQAGTHLGTPPWPWHPLTSSEPPWCSSAVLHACRRGASPARPGAYAGSSLHPPETGI